MRSSIPSSPDSPCALRPGRLDAARLVAAVAILLASPGVAFASEGEGGAGRLAGVGAASPAAGAQAVEGASGVSPASALSPVESEDEPLREAKALFARGSEAYEARRYAEALTHFQAAFARAPLPAFLFNVAQCHRMLHRPQEALRAYRRYLDNSPEPPRNAELTRELISDMEARLAWQKRTEQELRLKVEESLRVELAHGTSAPAPAPTPSAPLSDARLTPLHRSWQLWAGVGLFLVVSGTLMVTVGPGQR